MDIKTDNTTSLTIDRCVYLGLQDDPQTVLGFPSIWNYCHKAHPSASVSLAYQKEYCQCAGHPACPLSQGDGVQRLPVEARGHFLSPSSHHRGQGLGLIVLFLFLLAAGILSAWLFDMGFIRVRTAPIAIVLSPTGRDLPAVATRGAGATALPVPSSAVASPTPGVGPGPIASQTSARTDGLCGYQLDEPIQAERQFIIHRARGGESINQYASDYETSVEAILAANYQLPVPLHVDWVLVIPVETLDLQGMPRLQPYFESAGGIGLKDLAGTLSVQQSDLRKYNGFAQDCRAISGWLLVPRTAGS